MAWITDSRIEHDSLGSYIQTFTHELVESATNPQPWFLAGWHFNVAGVNPWEAELCDICANYWGTYGADTYASYWSKNDSATPRRGSSCASENSAATLFARTYSTMCSL